MTLDSPEAREVIAQHWGQRTSTEISKILGSGYTPVYVRVIARKAGLAKKAGGRHGHGDCKPEPKKAKKERAPKVEKPKKAKKALPPHQWARQTGDASVNSLMSRSHPASTVAAVLRVAEKHAPDRRCAGHDYEGNGRSMPCVHDAVRGKMWCPLHLETAEQLKECA